MSDDLVKRLLKAAEIQWQQSSFGNLAPIETYMEHEAADRIQELEAQVERLEDDIKDLFERSALDIFYGKQISCERIKHPDIDDYTPGPEDTFVFRQSTGDSNG